MPVIGRPAGCPMTGGRPAGRPYDSLLILDHPLFGERHFGAPIRRISQSPILESRGHGQMCRPSRARITPVPNPGLTPGATLLRPSGAPIPRISNFESRISNHESRISKKGDFIRVHPRPEILQSRIILRLERLFLRERLFHGLHLGRLGDAHDAFLDLLEAAALG